MLYTALAIFVVFLLLLLAEYASRAKGIHSELTRKFVHMSVGSFVAVWPFFLSWHQIQLLSFLFLIVVAASVRLNVFRSIHAVQRNALGEVLFALVIGVLALICTNPWIFMVAMLHLSLGDGTAAIVGTLWGGKHQYRVMKSTKSMAGTAAFLVCSLLIVTFYVAVGPGHASALALLALPLVATVTENVAAHGTDNLFMPIVVALLLMRA